MPILWNFKDKRKSLFPMQYDVKLLHVRIAP